jgi:hypothetical protein
MEFSIKEFAPIKEANIKLNGLTVIAGDNDTGKSRAGKLLYCIVKASRALGPKKVKARPVRAVPVRCKPVMALPVGWEAVEDELEVLGERLFGSDFEVKEVKLDTFWASIDQQGVIDFDYGVSFKDVLLIETPVIWDFFPTFQTGSIVNQIRSERNEPSSVKFPYIAYDVYARLNVDAEPYTSKLDEKSLKILDSLHKSIRGELVFKDSKPFFQRGNEYYPINNVATGIRSYALIQRVLELGIAAAPDQLLILDEPEVHLHPKWQLEYAKLLVDMVDKLGLKVLLTTHSSIFVEAIDFVGRKKLGERCSVYLSERDAKDDVYLNEVTDDLDRVYDALSEPLLRLSLLQEDA